MATVLTNAGKAKMIDGVYGTALTAPTYAHWGTGTTTAAATQTALVTPSAEARVNGTKSKETTTVADDTYRVTATITSASSQTISEAGLFDASSSGTMYIRGDFTGVALANGDSMAFTFNLTQA
jgi:hypothetical protein